MSLKSYLEKTIRKVGSNANTPSGYSIEIPLTAGESGELRTTNYTPPCDGFIYLYDAGTPKGHSRVDNGFFKSGHYSPNAITDFLAWLPVKKGEVTAFVYNGSDAVAKFFATVGGRGLAFLIRHLGLQEVAYVA
jgi:hypothetical protein